MQTISIDYPAEAALARPVHVGAVSSGDLEIVVTPAAERANEAVVDLRTSVDGFDTVWRRVLDRFFEEPGRYAGHYEINDFGATPGMVTLRLAQAAEIARGDAEVADTTAAPATTGTETTTTEGEGR